MPELVASAEPLTPGRYTRRLGGARIQLEIGHDRAGGWFAVQSFDGFFDVQQGVGTPDVVAVQFANVVAVFGAAGEDAVADGAAPVTASDAADAIEALRANPGLRVVEASPAVMAGFDGLGATVDHAGPAAFSPVLAVPPGPISILPGRRLWLGFFDTGAGLLAIMVGGSITGWAEAVTAAQPILASVSITS